MSGYGNKRNGFVGMLINHPNKPQNKPNRKELFYETAYHHTTDTCLCYKYPIC